MSLGEPLTVVSAGVYREIFSHRSSGQTFHQGLTVSIGLTHTVP